MLELAVTKLLLISSYYNSIPYVQKRDMEGIHETEMELVEMKTTLSGMKNPLDGINSALDTAEENITDLEDTAEVTIQMKHKDTKQL